MYAMDWLECEHKMREWLPMVQVCPIFLIFPVDGGGSVYKNITDIGKWFQVYNSGNNKALVDAWTVNITLMRQHSHEATSLTAWEEYTLAFPAKIRSVQNINYLHFRAPLQTLTAFSAKAKGTANR
jgi:hypothetical protein